MSDARSVWSSNVARNLGPNSIAVILLSYGVDTAMLYGFAQTGTMSVQIPLIYAAVGVCDVALFYILAGLIAPTMRVDGFLAVQRLVVSAAIQITFMLVVPSVALYFLTALFLVFALGTMGMSGIQSLLCWISLIGALGYVLDRNHGMAWLPQDTTSQRLLVWTFFAIMMGRAAIIGSFGRSMTIRLRKRSEALAATRARLQENLTGVLKGVKESALSVATAARQLNAGTSELSLRTAEQAANLKETASSMQQMTATVKQNAGNAKLADTQALAARDKAEQGGSIVRQAVAAMDAINTASNRIAAIISVIDELAFQTNLLALNAAVEAARAGDQGRGFAVVASEVRNLAHRSAEAAKEISALINDSVAKVSEGGRLVSESGRHLEEIVAAVKAVTSVVGQITIASQEQASNAEEISRVVLQMDDTTQRNAAMVHQASTAAALMNDEAKRLIELTAQFKLEDADLGRVRSA